MEFEAVQHYETNSCGVLRMAGYEIRSVTGLLSLLLLELVLYAIYPTHVFQRDAP